MDSLFFFFLFSQFPHVDLEQAPPPEKAKATVTAGESRLFSGENVQMTCSVPDDPDADWTYTWFYENTLLSSAKVYNLNNALVTQSGDYSCQGEKTITSWPYIVSANRSEPLNIYVDGKCLCTKCCVV